MSGLPIDPAIFPQVMLQHTQAIQHLLAQANNHQPQPPAAPGPARMPPMRTPELPKFDGKAAKLDSWLADITMALEYHGDILTATQKVAFTAMHLAGAARDWWQSLAVESRPADTRAFGMLLRAQFQHVDAALDARLKLAKLKQGTRSVQEFRQLQIPLPDDSEQSRLFAFVTGLRPALQAKVLQNPTEVNTVAEAIQFAARAEARSALGASLAVGGGGHSAASGSSAMDLSRAEDADASDDDRDEGSRLAYLEGMVAAQAEQLAAFSTRRERGYGKPRYEPTSGVTPEMIAHRRDNQLCYGCGSNKHIKRDCDKQPARGGPSSRGSSRGRGGRFASSKGQGK
jgi:hypothetical protein